MSLQQWANNGWLRPHQTSPQEVGELLAMVDRDLTDAEGDIRKEVLAWLRHNHPALSRGQK